MKEFKIGDKVMYDGMKWRVSFVHRATYQRLRNVFMYDLKGKNGRFCCVINMGNISLIKRK